MTKDEVLEIYRKEAEKRGQKIEKRISSEGIEYYVCGEPNMKRLAKTAIRLLG